MRSIFDDITLDRISVGDVLGALSHALDLTEGQPPGHSLRACEIGMEIAARLGLTEAERADIFHALLLKDLGCSSNAARICELYLTDDQAFKRGFKTIGASTRSALGFVLRHTGADQGLAQRVRTIANVLSDRDAIQSEVFRARCDSGAEIARGMGFGEAVAASIAGLDEHWDGGGRPFGLAGEDIPLGARIALLAQVIDVFGLAEGADAARAEVLARRGTWFDPDLVDAALPVISGRLWSEADATIEARVMAHTPARAVWPLDEDVLDNLVAGFSQVVDRKSPFTYGHASRVGDYTDMICARLDITPQARRWMRRAALLHDIGKLGISNRLLDAPRKLTEAEFDVMKTHPTLGQAVLGRIDIFAGLALVAGAHHERLDGAGYPLGLGARDLPWEVRVVTVADIFDALTADRPYRAAIEVDEALRIMDRMADAALDPEYIGVLKSALHAAPGAVQDQSGS